MAKKLSRISPLEAGAGAGAVGSSMMVSDDEDEREDIGNGNLKVESKLKAEGYKGNLHPRERVWATCYGLFNGKGSARSVCSGSII